jgi:hypothetical protein
MGRILAVAVMLTFSLLSWSQVTYSNDKEKFVKEFQKSLTDYGKGDFHDFSKNVFPVLLLESGTFPDAYFQRMVETCNLIISRRLNPYPEVYNYVFSVSALVKGKQSKESFEAWHSSVDKMLDARNIKKFEDFIELSAGFFDESRLATASNFNWYYEGGSYAFEYTDKPFIRFSEGNLVCRVQSKRTGDDGKILDSLVVYKTGGTYDPILKKWEGSGGKITWEKVGIDPNTTFAMLKKYDVSLKASTLRADTVDMTTTYMSKPIKGTLNDRAFTINREEDMVYPQFLSFDQKLLIKDLVKDLDYVGGISLQGASFMGAGSAGNKARITYKKDGKVFVKVDALQVFKTNNRVSVKPGKLTMYLQTGDSITHPGIDFVYDLENNSLSMTRFRNGIGEAPFRDSYHALEIYVPKITWDIGSENMLFTYPFEMSQEQRVAQFESVNYFNAELYDRLQAMSTTHPLVAIWNYCYKFDEYVINEGKAATALGMTIEQAKTSLLQLSNMGFISYDTEAKMVTVNKKLETFVRAKGGKIDYDNMVFVSDLRPKELKGYSEEQIKSDPNLTALAELYKKQNEERRIMKNFGSMSLKSLEMDLAAVDRVVISANRNTAVFPEKGEVKIKQNRDFNFSGWLNAGKLEINAKAAKFDYNAYSISLLGTDESIFRVRPLRQEDGQKSIAMVSSIHGISGTVFIDDPTNRSGNKPGFDKFPKIKSTTASNIFYNSKDIYRGAYDSTRFYYTVFPFEKDSLNSFKESAFRLDGELTSAGIFPKMKEKVKIMPDYSFGFSTQAPSGGYTFYGTEAKYENKIVLSNNGLQGAGTINFIHSSSESKALSFLPDSTIGLAQFVNRPMETGVQFPDVKATDAYITYVPGQKVLKAQSTPKNEMVFFGGEAKMRGTTYVRPNGMTGNGMMTFVTATVISDNFKYKRYDIDADTSSFNLRNESIGEDEDPLAFKTDNVNAHISFKERKGVFKSNEGESVVEFPVNQYMCKMDQFTWLMDELSIEMQKKGEREISINQGVDLVGPNFFSTHPKQDSLQFRAPKAKFDLKSKTIFCNEVEYVDIADARIYPDSMKLTIRKKAKIDKLSNARIVASYVTEYHKFTEAEVEINARRDYSAIGRYPYYDKDSLLTYITMDKIGLDTSFQTRASGKIAADMNFRLSKEFDYYGNVSVKASTPSILFEGATRINHSCEKFDRNWMAFKSEIDPKNIQIPVSNEMKDLEGKSISAGIVWHDSPSTDSIKLYPTFLSALYSPNDPIVMTANGYLQYDPVAKEFQISSREKLLNRGEKGNYIALHTESCSMNGDGAIKLGMDYGDVVLDAVGVVNYNQETGETSMNITARFDMAMDKGIMQGVAERIVANEGLKPMESSWSAYTLEQAILEWDGREEADKTLDQYVREGSVKKLPDGLDKTMTITGIRLSSFDKKSSQDKGLISTFDYATLVSIYGKPVFRQIPFKAFFQQTYSLAGSDKFIMYMNIPGGSDYLFHYSMEKKDGTMYIKSGDGELNAALTELKDDKKKTKNFRYEATNNSVYLVKFMEIFGQ